MRKRVAPILLTSVLVLSAVPATSWANNASLEKINKEISAIQSRMKSQEKELKSINQQISVLRNQQEKLEDQLMAIDLRRNETQKKIDRLDKEIDQTKQKAVEAQEQLDAAEERVAKRDTLLKTRLKAMYERGTVSYLEVLLGSANVTDFLTRLEALQLIFQQDKRILEENLRDKEMIAAKKQEVERHLKSLETMFAEAEQLKAELDKQYKQSTVIKAELEKKEQDLHEITEEMEQNLLALAAQYRSKVAEKSRLQSVSSYTGGKLGLPLAPGSYRITSGFGVRTDPFTGRSAGHNGIDMAAPKGTPIYAAEDGIVILAGYNQGFGNSVVIQHNDEISTLYAHIREGGIMVKVGQAVKRGEKIAEVGSTGRSTGNHLHFTVYKNNKAVDPTPYLR